MERPRSLNRLVPTVAQGPGQGGPIAGRHLSRAVVRAGAKR